MPYMTVDGLRTYYEVYGEGAPVLLVHGAAQDSLSWRFNIDAAAANAQVWVIDLPGHGKSQLPPGGPISNLDDYGAFVEKFITACDLNDVIIVGHSMAGGIALYTAMAAPERVAGVVPVDGAGFTSGTYGGNIFELVRINPSDWFEVNFRMICSKRTHPGRVDEIAFDVQRCAPGVAYNDIVAYGRFDYSERLKDVSVPVGFIHGADDWSITPDMSRRTREMLSCPTKYILLEGTGHFPHTENPAAFNPALKEILAWMRGAGK